MTRGKQVKGRRVAGHRPAKRPSASGLGSGKAAAAVTEPAQERPEPSRAEAGLQDVDFSSADLWGTSGCSDGKPLYPDGYDCKEQ